MSTILIVEDERSNLDFFQRALEREGHCVLCAMSGAEAREICRHKRMNVDLVIADAVLREGSGARLALEIAGDCGSPPVLLVSSCPPDILMDQGYLDDARRRRLRLLQKPFTAARFVKAVASVLPGTPSPAMGAGS